MHDDPKPLAAAPQTASSRLLRRVADALGVPVSSFGDVDTGATPVDGSASPEEIALLATVHSYLKRAHPEARDRFVTAVQTMVKRPAT